MNMNTDQQALPLYSYENTPSSSSFAGVRKTIVKKHVDVTCPKTTRTHVLLVRETYSGGCKPWPRPKGESGPRGSRKLFVLGLQPRCVKDLVEPLLRCLLRQYTPEFAEQILDSWLSPCSKMQDETGRATGAANSV